MTKIELIVATVLKEDICLNRLFPFKNQKDISNLHSEFIKHFNS